ncbi:DUF3237 domain-containing protein [Sphingomonas sp. AP4-R1]|uniref:DUF3237 domain-containing protein n=1 Tax=Sphingomonas sp. AP4-R1 TaxID=2735134 RepID=UPI001493689C|nr:DUF3237 domain-containing protein [Sphingomonas sp. AP4-R1]QJU58055.1 DUF3237 domain-containing protein [Sphingomonas sp. AP4-R1]
MLTLAIITAAVAAGATALPAPPAPGLHYAFTIAVTLADPIEQGIVDGRRKRFVPITGGTVSGPKLEGIVLPGGGDWQTIGADGLTIIDTRYTLKARDGTVIDILNPGVRVASPDVSAKLARGEPVGPDAYYFRTTPRMSVADGPHDWLRRTVFVARGIRNPDTVQIDVFSVD